MSSPDPSGGRMCRRPCSSARCAGWRGPPRSGRSWPSSRARSRRSTGSARSKVSCCPAPSRAPCSGGPSTCGARRPAPAVARRGAAGVRAGDPGGPRVGVRRRPGRRCAGGAAFGMAGGYALSGRGPRWARWAAGAVALLPVPAWLVGGVVHRRRPRPRHPAGRVARRPVPVPARGALPSAARSRTAHRPSSSRPVGGWCSWAASAGWRGAPGCGGSWPRPPAPTRLRVSWLGTFGIILPISAVVGGLLGWAEHLRRTGDNAPTAPPGPRPAAVHRRPGLAGGHAARARGRVRAGRGGGRGGPGGRRARARCCPSRRTSPRWRWRTAASASWRPAGGLGDRAAVLPPRGADHRLRDPAAGAGPGPGDASAGRSGLIRRAPGHSPMRPVTRRAVLVGLLAIAPARRLRGVRTSGPAARAPSASSPPSSPRSRSGSASRRSCAQARRCRWPTTRSRRRSSPPRSSPRSRPARCARPGRRAARRPRPARRRVRRRRRAAARPRRHGGLPRRAARAGQARRQHRQVRPVDAGHATCSRSTRRRCSGCPAAPTCRSSPTTSS